MRWTGTKHWTGCHPLVMPYGQARGAQQGMDSKGGQGTFGGAGVLAVIRLWCGHPSLVGIPRTVHLHRVSFTGCESLLRAANLIP